MASESPSAVRRGAKEFVLIVVGVLVALWLDAGWTWLQDRQEEQVLRDDLATEFRNNRDALAESLASMDRTVGAIDLIIAGVQGGSMPDSAGVMFSALTLERYNPRLGVLSSAIASGRFELLRDAELRASLAGWSGLAEDAAEGVDWVIPDIFELLRTFTGWFTLEPALRETSGSSWASIIERLRADPRLVGHFATKRSLMNESRREYRRLMEETDRILSLLRPAGDSTAVPG